MFELFESGDFGEIWSRLLTKCCERGCGGDVSSEYISKTRGSLKMWANLVKVAILAKFGQGC